jgi:release factor glutamine methyltransferase
MVNAIGLIKKAEEKIDRVDAEILLARLLGITRTGLYIYDDPIKADIIDRFNAWTRQRAGREPLQYIIGRTGFMGLEFIVTPDVLIPRPETELLVEAAIGLIKSMSPGPLPLKLLDLGTGSGNIAISLTKLVSDCKIIASDISRGALSVARRNARLNKVDAGRIDFVWSDLFEDLPAGRFNLIISNPPYVASGQFSSLQDEVRRFEPRTALDGAADGLGFYRKIISSSPGYLRKEGFLLLEIGLGQDSGVKRLFEINNFYNIRFIRDYNNIMRVAVAQWTN